MSELVKKKKIWRKGEISRLRRDYNKKPIGQIAFEMGRSKSSIYHKISALGLTKRPHSQNRVKVKYAKARGKVCLLLPKRPPKKKKPKKNGGTVSKKRA